MLNQEIAKKIKASPEWDVLEQHLIECVVALDGVSDIPEGPDFERVARGRKYAVECIKKILQPFDIEDLVETDARGEALEKLGMV